MPFVWTGTCYCNDSTNDLCKKVADNFTPADVIIFHQFSLHPAGGKTNRHWMMHCGPQKGAILQEFLLERYREYSSCGSTNHPQQQSPPRPPFIIVELGSYCGYSAIRMAQALSFPTSVSTSSSLQQQPQPPNNFHIYSIDVQPKLLRIATEMTRLAGMDHCITYVLRSDGNHHGRRHDDEGDDDDGDDDSSLHHLLQETLAAADNTNEPVGTTTTTNHRMVHFCLLDHAKDMYLPDLQQLERYGYLRRGSAAAADNVIFARIDEYRRHVQSADYITTRLVEGSLEYQNDIRDGIGALHITHTRRRHGLYRLFFDLILFLLFWAHLLSALFVFFLVFYVFVLRAELSIYVNDPTTTKTTGPSGWR
jgi:catechol O-methyltransferase